MKRLMIVDDEFLVRLGIASLTDWEKHGYTIVAEAENGEEALKKMDTAKPQIVLTDLMMSPGDGFGLIKTCLQKYPDMKFIVLSNYNDFDNVRKAMKLGASDYVFKLTLKPQELLQILDEVSRNMKETSEGKSRETTVQKNAEIIKADLLKKLMDARDRHYTEILKALEKFPLCVSLHKPYCILSMCIDNFRIVRHQGNFLESDLLKFTMENMIHEIFGMPGKMEIFQYGDCGFIVVFAVSGQAEASLREEIQEKFLTLNQYSVKYYGVSLSGIVSETTEGAEHLKSLIQKNETQAERRFWNKEIRLLWAEDLRETSEFQELPLEQRGWEWEEKIKADGLSVGMEYIEERLLHLKRTEPYDIRMVRKYLSKVSGALAYYLGKEHIDFEHVEDGCGVNLEAAVREYDYFDDIVRSFGELKEQYLELYREKRGRPLRREITEVKNYVQNYYQEKLSVAQIAESVNMSESRFSHVFKKEMGVSFWEYVNQVRMNQAEKLLRETDMRIGDIAEKIGMENPNYFSTQFKKRKGESPLEYRKRTE